MWPTKARSLSDPFLAEDYPKGVELIYALASADEYIYVGKTTNLSARIEAHLAGRGSEWTRKHRPVSLLFARLAKGPFDEDNTTKQMMAKYGINRVRGGSYCQMQLLPGEIQCLEREFHTAYDLCFSCGRPNHFAAHCRETPRNNICVIEKPQPKPKARKGRFASMTEEERRKQVAAATQMFMCMFNEMNQHKSY